jgi:hypothetical protein
MEKRGIVEPGRTPDVEARLTGQKQAQAADPKQQIKTLDDDFTKRAAAMAEETTRAKH